MKRLVLTGWSGASYKHIAKHTVPLIRSYAKRHGTDFACSDLSGAGTRPPSWGKIPAFLAALQTYDQLLWIDADVVIVDGRDSLFDAVRANAWQALVEINRPRNQSINCGVWLVTPSMLPALQQVWEMEQYIHHPWWENRGLLDLMGYIVCGPNNTDVYPEAKTDLRDKTHYLDTRWNYVPGDANTPVNPYFVHLAGMKTKKRLRNVRRYERRVR